MKTVTFQILVSVSILLLVYVTRAKYKGFNIVYLQITMIHNKKIIILSCCFCLQMQVALCEGISTEQFLREAPKGWKQLDDEYRKGYSSLNDCRFGSPSSEPDEVLDQGRSSASCRHLLQGRHEIFVDSREKTEYLTCLNDKYGFVLVKDRENEHWQINSVSLQPSNMLFGNIGTLQGSIGIFECIMVEGAWLDAAINSKGFNITKIETVPDVDTDKPSSQIKVSFTCSFDVDEHNQILSGTFWFNPNLFWVLSRYDIRLKSDTLGTASKSLYYKVIDGVPYPEKIVLDYKFDGDPPIRYVTEYTDTMNKVDSSVFYLSHYGFSEPDNPTRRVNTVRIILMAIGIILIIIGLFMRYFATKKS